MYRKSKRAVEVVLIVTGIAVAGCDSNLAASLGGSTVGGRGSIRVIVINNTPHSAVFTLGTFDRADETSQPDFRQSALDDGTILDGESSSAADSLVCGRAFGVGSPQLIDLISGNSPPDRVNESALVEGVAFFSANDETGTDSELVGSAPPFEALLGEDFPCNALLIIRLEFNDLGPDAFRVDFELIPPVSTR